MLEIFKVYDCGLPKRRYGNQYDGGYVIVDGLEYDCFISGGLGGNITFEEDFRKSTDIPMHLFDLCSLLNYDDNDFTLHKFNITGENNDYSINLHNFLNNYKNIFIKLDIEGSEYPWLDALPINLQLNIKQLVIEFHGLEHAIRRIKRLQRTHTLIHLHGNNYSPMVTVDGVGFPNVFECTFLRTSNFNFKPSSVKLPCKLDGPNNPYKQEINLDYL